MVPMIRRWDLTILQFFLLFEALGRDDLPVPLFHEPRYSSDDEYRQAAAVAAEQNAALLRDDPDLYAALTVLNSCETWAQFTGFVGVDHNVCVHLAFHGDRAVILDQVRTPDGDYVVYLFSLAASEAGHGLSQLIPGLKLGNGKLEVPLPMLQPIAIEDENDIPDPWWHAAAQWKSFSAADFSGMGHLIVVPGPTVDYRPTFGAREVRFVAVTGQGGYLLRIDRDKLHVDPIDTPGLATMFQATFDTVLRLYRLDHQDTTGGHW